MTFMLKDTGQAAFPPAREIPSAGERVAAQFRLDRVTGDSLKMQSRAAETDLLREMRETLGDDVELPRSSAPRWRDIGRAVDQVKELRQFDPDRFGHLPASREEFDAEVLRRRREEVAELQDLLGAAPEGSWGPELIGSLGAGLRDEWTLITLPFGAAGGLSVGRVAAIEALAGGAGEALSLPDQYRASEELGTPPPNPAFQIGVAGALSGALGGAVAGGVRYISYRRARSAASELQRLRGEGPLEFGDELERSARELNRERGYDLGREEPAEAASGPLTISDFDFTPAGNASPSSNRIGYVFGRLLERGMPPHIAAGFVGNFMVEAGVMMNPSIRGDGGAAHGIAQWNDRAPALKAFARKRGTDWTDLDTQIDFLWHELETSEAGAWARIQGATTAAEAARLVSQYYERPGVPHLGRRTGHANAVMRQYEGGAVPRWTGEAPADGGGGGGSYTSSRPYTATGEVTVGDDMRVRVDYQVVDLSDLRQAQGELQPRDRGRVASDAWVTDTAARLDPAQLMDSPWADRGAPLVGPDNVIESGNGRVRAIERAYAQVPDRAEAYRRQIEERTGKAIPEGMERPVLIARRTSELSDANRQRLVVDAQDSGVARMNATERAQIGRRALDADLLARYDPSSELTSAANRDFARAFAGAFPRSERNAFIDQAGGLSIDGVRQVQDSLFARAYEAPDILARYAESAPGELRSLMDALAQAAPAFARLRAAIDAGDVRPEMDITPFVLDAARLIMSARELAQAEGGKLAAIVDELLDAVDLLDGAAVAPLTAALVRKMMPGGRQASAKQIADFLDRYAGEAMKAGRTGDALLEQPGPLDVLKAIDRNTFGALTETGRAGHVDPQPEVGDAEMLAGSFDQGAASPGAEMGDAQAEANLREAVETTSVQRTDPDNADFLDTRGVGTRFHGSRDAVLEGDLYEGAYSSLNYYGQGFYTTDAVTIARGYNKGGGVYTVREKVPVTAFDMEQPVPAFLQDAVHELDEMSELRGLFEEALDEAPASTRELYDTIRDISRGAGISADEVQGLLEILEGAFKENGFNALDHVGGLRTKRASHQVRIYLDPHETVAVEEVDPDVYRVKPEPISPPVSQNARIPDEASARAPLPEDAALDAADAELRAAGGELEFTGPDGTAMSLREVLDDLDADADLEAALDACPTGRAA
ncbi:phage tail tip lysozyme [Pseudooceanicola sp.]|uniref:phage tail tip lysozyme n=1 Tax=Pseudooceanicola sp. TaxID=1914328 RepID=UPI0040583340